MERAKGATAFDGPDARRASTRSIHVDPVGGGMIITRRDLSNRAFDLAHRLSSFPRVSRERWQPVRDTRKGH